MEGFDLNGVLLAVIGAAAIAVASAAASFYAAFKAKAAADGVDDWRDKLVSAVNRFDSLNDEKE